MVRKKVQATSRAEDEFDESRFVLKTAQDRYHYILEHCTVLHGYYVEPNDVDELMLKRILAKLEKQYLTKLIHNSEPTFRDEVAQFYANMTKQKDGSWKTGVNGLEFVVSWWKINEILGCPYQTDTECAPAKSDGHVKVCYNGTMPTKEEAHGLDKVPLALKYFGRHHVNHRAAADTYNTKFMDVEDNILYEIIHKTVVPTPGYSTEPTTTTAMEFFFVVEEKLTNPWYTILQRMINAIKGKEPRVNLPYGSFITFYLHSWYKKSLKKPFNILSEGEKPCKLDTSYFDERRLVLVKGQWVNKPPKIKNKREQQIEKQAEDENVKWKALYSRMKGKIPDFLQVSKEAYMVTKQFRAITRAERDLEAHNGNGEDLETLMQHQWRKKQFKVETSLNC